MMSIRQQTILSDRTHLADKFRITHVGIAAAASFQVNTLLAIILTGLGIPGKPSTEMKFRGCVMLWGMYQSTASVAQFISTFNDCTNRVLLITCRYNLLPL